MMRVCVLGHRGMLGHVVCRYLKEAGHKVLTLDGRFEASHSGAFVAKINDLDVQWCVNCIGILKRGEVSPSLMDSVNHCLPAECSRKLLPCCGLIHASSDGVFSASSSACYWDSPLNAADDYGVSKGLAETALQRENDFIIRCSIVGPEQGTQRSLLAWLEAQRGEVPGYTNRMWNGVTTLEWAKCCDSILRGVDGAEGRIVQLASMPPVSKRDLLQTMADCWGWNVSVRPVEADLAVSRYMVPNVPAVPIRTLLAELKTWY